MFAYSRALRLHQTTHIQKLFDKGKHFGQYPFRVLYLKVNDLPGAPFRILISVSKRYVRSAVRRNRLKRQMREAIRHHQHILWDTLPPRAGTLLIAILFSAKEMPSYSLTEEKIIRILTRLSELDEKPT